MCDKVNKIKEILKQICKENPDKYKTLLEALEDNTKTIEQCIDALGDDNIKAVYQRFNGKEASLDMANAIVIICLPEYLIQNHLVAYIKQWTEMEITIKDEQGNQKTLKVSPPYVMNYTKKKASSLDIKKKLSSNIYYAYDKENRAYCYVYQEKPGDDYLNYTNNIWQRELEINNKWKNLIKKRLTEASKKNKDEVESKKPRYDYQYYGGEFDAGKASPRGIQLFLEDIINDIINNKTKDIHIYQNKNVSYNEKKRETKLLYDALQEEQQSNSDKDYSDVLCQFLRDYGIGVDCSGFVSRAIQYVMGQFKVSFKDQNKTFGKYPAGAITLANHTRALADGGKIMNNARELTINNNLSLLKPGDIIVTPEHIKIIYGVGYDVKKEKYYYLAADSSTKIQKKTIVDPNNFNKILSIDTSEKMSGIKLEKHYTIESNVKYARPKFFDDYYKGLIKTTVNDHT